MPMAKITKLVMITCTAFLERQKPVSTMAKPACMKNTREPPKIRKKRLRAVLTWPSSATVSAALGHVKTALNLFFLIFGGSLVFFMQAGFAMVETGFCRSKNAVHVIMTNFVIFAIGIVAYWAVGFALQFGGVGTLTTLGATQPLSGLAQIAPGWGVIGHQGFFLSGRSYDVAIMGFFFFQLVFMDTAATIPTGAMAERWKFSSFVVYGFFMAAIVYPIYGNWVWGGGWLR